MAPPIHLGAWSMALMLWLPFELLLLLLLQESIFSALAILGFVIAIFCAMNAAAWGRSRELCKDIDEDDDEAENSYCNSPIFIPWLFFLLFKQ